MPHRKPLLEALHNYENTWISADVPGTDSELERQTLATLRDFVQRREDCLERSCQEGHITGSALVTNQAMTHVLLTLHAKLGKWLQLGGHVDGEIHVEQAAYREAEEESGLRSLVWVPQPFTFAAGERYPFDCDIHLIPARPSEAAHYHYDLRYLLMADQGEELIITSESKALRWVSLTEARQLTQEPSMLRQFQKLELLQKQLKSPDQRHFSQINTSF